MPSPQYYAINSETLVVDGSCVETNANDGSDAQNACPCCTLCHTMDGKLVGELEHSLECLI
jgi:hypothetical protein